jgi:hypothetical protein
MSTTDPKPVDNGVNVEALLGAREALGKAPEAAKFTWRAKCDWVKGTHSRSTVESFFGLGEEQQHKTSFSFEADHPEVFASEATLEGDMDIQGILGIDSEVRNGFNRIKVTYNIDADATPDEIKALVAQSQKRSAVFDVISNPTDVSVEVA